MNQEEKNKFKFQMDNKLLKRIKQRNYIWNAIYDDPFIDQIINFFLTAIDNIKFFLIIDDFDYLLNFL